jgi:RNA polymerase sigma-70 factor (ECF subfamily)
VGAAIEEITQHRSELRSYCHRMLRSGFDADDAVQETLVRAWRSSGRFEGRASVRTWLYRIATNVCIDMLRSRREEPAADLDHFQPFAHAPSSGRDPAHAAESTDDVRRAFIVALQHLPPLQRTVLVLREGLRWRAAEVAEALDTTPAAVNSALQRARATLAAQARNGHPSRVPSEHRFLVACYVDAFQRRDGQSLIALG